MGNILGKIFSNGAEKLVNAVTGGLDSLITNKEEREAAKLALQQEINRHIEAMQASSDKELEAQLSNTKDARAREVEFVKATGQADKMQIAVGVIIMVSFFAALIVIGFKAIPPGNEHIMINAVGILEGLVMSVAGYYYGSSLGSRIKDMKK
jgi:hypothetical protein